MSRTHINAYRTHLAKLHAVTGSLNEGVVSAAFGGLLEKWGRSQDLTLVNQWEGKGPRGNNIRVDGALVPGVLRIPFGYWEAKDSKDDLDKEIVKKRASGYPVDNIIYEDTREAVLVQNNVTVERAQMADDDALLRLLTRFFDFQRPEIAEFRKAARQFKADLPAILDALRDALDSAEANNAAYVKAAREFLDHAKAAINPAVNAADVREMLIQHILTEEIFTSVFDDATFHRENNVAKRITALEDAFFTRELRGATKERLRPYYNAIKGAAADTADRREKQTFLKNLYEDFYKVYNPKAADRLGVVYTPGEIVRFMIRGADWLCEKHFGKTLIDKGVEILDPATGTGTFIVELLEHFQGDRDKLRYKYKEELHANEVAILPYYVANLNIEATYAAITGQYAEFPGLVFVDTLDNVGANKATKSKAHVGDMFGTFTDENMERIKRQNTRKISVIMGNPPYNANQINDRNNNQNRKYRFVDTNIRNTYIRLSEATKTSAYDPYVRFFRWATDRISEEGVICFVSNRNFYDTGAFDGFRKSVVEEFSEIWIVDLGGDVRDNPKLSGTKHNPFGIQTGVAISFLVKTKIKTKCTVRYSRRPEFEPKSEKLSFLESASIDSIEFSVRTKTETGDWSGRDTTDFRSLVATARKGRKQASNQIFDKASTGLMTGRDDWIYSRSPNAQRSKAKRLIDEIAKRKQISEVESTEIKWSRNLRRGVDSAKKAPLIESIKFTRALFRPFLKLVAIWDDLLVDEDGGQIKLVNPENRAIAFLSVSSSNRLSVLATSLPYDYGLLKQGNGGTQGLFRYRYLPSGERVDNITDWALNQFRTRYAAEAPDLSKDDIFAYVYAVLHDPIYRETYAADLRREFPRIPLYDDFARWRNWGQALLDLHIGYEGVEPAVLTRVDVPGRGAPVPKLKSLPDTGTILLDSETQLTGVPRAAWDYRLGNRAAIDWVLDQHKEKKIKDPTVARLFDNYRFADHKERVVDLLARVVTVSMRTVAITWAMEELSRCREPQDQAIASL